MSDIRHDHHFCDGCKESARERQELVEGLIKAGTKLNELELENARLTRELHGTSITPDGALQRVAELLKVAEAVDAHYSASLDYQPAYVRLAREALAQGAS